MSEPTMENLVQRLDSLERQNRWLKRIDAILLFGIAAAFLMGQSQCNLSKTGVSQASKLIEAQKFIVRDANGKERARFTETGLTFSDSNGTERVHLLVGDLITQLEFFVEGRRMLLGICNDKSNVDCPSSAQLLLAGGEGNVRLDAGNQPFQNIGGWQPFLSISSNKGGSVQLEGNTVELTRARVPRIRLSVDDDGPSIDLLDKNWHTRATLGSTSLTATRTGAVKKTAESSLVLFDKDDKVIWSTP